MKNKYNKKHLGVILLILVAAGAAIFFSYSKIQPSKQASSATETNENKSPDNKPSHHALPQNTTFTVGVLYWSMNIPGQVAMRKGLEQQAELINNNRKPEKPAIKLLQFIAGDGIEGIERQIKQMHELVKKKVDIIIVQPTDIAALGPPLIAANKAGIPVVAYDQHILGGDLTCFVTSNNYQAGYQDGEYVAANFPSDKKIRIILVEYPHVSSTVKRVDGFIDALEDYNQQYTIVKNYTAVEPVSGKKAGADILADFPNKNDFDVIFSVNDGGGLAVVQALQDAGRNEVFFATVDGDPESVHKIRKKSIIRIDSAQFCGELGAEAMRMAYRVLCGEKTPSQVFVPTFPITRETVDLYHGWTAPMPSRFKKPWNSKIPYWSPETIVHSKKAPR